MVIAQGLFLFGDIVTDVNGDGEHGVCVHVIPARKDGCWSIREVMANEEYGGKNKQSN